MSDETVAIPGKLYSFSVTETTKEYWEALDQERGIEPRQATKHLPGQHDQDSHGNWARGSSEYEFGKGTYRSHGVAGLKTRFSGSVALMKTWKGASSEAYRENDW